MVIALTLLVVLTTIAELVGANPAAPLEQWHLGREVVPLEHLDPPLMGVTKTDVVHTPISAGAMQPDAVHSGKPEDQTSLASAMVGRELCQPYGCSLRG